MKLAIAAALATLAVACVDLPDDPSFNPYDPNGTVPVPISVTVGAANTQAKVDWRMTSLINPLPVRWEIQVMTCDETVVLESASQPAQEDTTAGFGFVQSWLDPLPFFPGACREYSVAGLPSAGIATRYAPPAQYTRPLCGELNPLNSCGDCGSQCPDGAMVCDEGNCIDEPPTGLSYNVESALTYTKGTAIVALNPDLDGQVDSFSAQPSLPAGLMIDAQSGVISGTPTELAAATNYTVIATNDVGQAFTALEIAVTDAPPANLSYAENPAIYTKGVMIAPNAPMSTGGDVVSFTIEPPLPAGLVLGWQTGVISGTPGAIEGTAAYVVTATNSGGSTGVDLSITVDDVSPAQLTYQFSQAVYTKGTAIIPNRPTYVGGPATSFTAVPTLPLGLALDSTTGVISGIPSAVSDSATYAVTAENTGGSTTVDLMLAVADAPVVPVIATVVSATTGTAGLDASVTAHTGMSYLWTITNGSITSTGGTAGITSGGTNFITYAAGAIGTLSLTCTETNAAGASSAPGSATVSVLPVAPSDLAYALNPAIYTVGIQITADVPSAGGAGVSYSVSPNLPAGLALDPGSGAITGIPTTPTAEASYGVSATNSAGTASVPLVITVLDAPIEPTITTINTLSVGTEDVTAFVAARSGMTYAWSIDGGTITSNGGSSGVTSGGLNSIDYTAGDGDTLTLGCTESNAAGIAGPPASATVAVVATPTHQLGGSVSGLTGTGLVLSSPGEPDLMVAAGSTSFAFATALPSGADYSVVVSQQPSGVGSQSCSVSQGSGTVGSTDVNSVQITCSFEVVFAKGSLIIPMSSSWQDPCGAVSAYGLVYDILRANDGLASYPSGSVYTSPIAVHWVYSLTKGSPNRCMPTNLDTPPNSDGSWNAGCDIFLDGTGVSGTTTPVWQIDNTDKTLAPAGPASGTKDTFAASIDTTWSSTYYPQASGCNSTSQLSCMGPLIAFPNYPSWTVQATSNASTNINYVRYGGGSFVISRADVPAFLTLLSGEESHKDSQGNVIDFSPFRTKGTVTSGSTDALGCALKVESVSGTNVASFNTTDNSNTFGLGSGTGFSLSYANEHWVNIHRTALPFAADDSAVLTTRPPKIALLQTVAGQFSPENTGEGGPDSGVKGAQLAFYLKSAGLAFSGASGCPSNGFNATTSVIENDPALTSGLTNKQIFCPNGGVTGQIYDYVDAMDVANGLLSSYQVLWMPHFQQIANPQTQPNKNATAPCTSAPYSTSNTCSMAALTAIGSFLRSEQNALMAACASIGALEGSQHNYSSNNGGDNWFAVPNSNTQTLSCLDDGTGHCSTAATTQGLAVDQPSYALIRLDNCSNSLQPSNTGPATQAASVPCINYGAPANPFAQIGDFRWYQFGGSVENYFPNSDLSDGASTTDYRPGAEPLGYTIGSLNSATLESNPRSLAVADDFTFIQNSDDTGLQAEVLYFGGHDYTTDVAGTRVMLNAVLSLGSTSVSPDSARAAYVAAKKQARPRPTPPVTQEAVECIDRQTGGQ